MGKYDELFKEIESLTIQHQEHFNVIFRLKEALEKAERCEKLEKDFYLTNENHSKVENELIDCIKVYQRYLKIDDGIFTDEEKIIIMNAQEYVELQNAEVIE